MADLSLTRIINPWKHRRDEMKRRVEQIRQRDGDSCRRCRRPIRFDLPAGHDQGVRVEDISCGAGAAEGIANLCLTHGRCNVTGQDHSGLISERLRPQREAELFARAREKRRAA